MDAELAAVVRKGRLEACLESLNDRGAYDDRRRIEAVDDAHVAVPITHHIDHPAIDRVERGLATKRRVRDLADHLRARDWTDHEVAEAPHSYARIGDLILVDGWPSHRPADVGAALLDLHGDATGVFAQLDIDGAHRRPRLAHVAGTTRATTVHREHGIAYGLDLTAVMFSPGNQRERVRMGQSVDRDEHVLDLCAGIGYFTLPMAAAGARVTAFERNPIAFRWLTSNATRNRVDGRVVPINADCRGALPRADRVVLGHLPVHDCRGDAPTTGGGYLDAALRALQGTGRLHVHGLAYADEHDRAEVALERRLTARGVASVDRETRRVKSVAPRTDHIVLDVAVEPTTG